MGRCKERVTESMALKWLERRSVKDGKITRATKVKDLGYGGHLRLHPAPPAQVTWRSLVMKGLGIDSACGF